MAALTWIAHDRAEHDRINSILAALRLPDARDEMGIGGIRDALADAMFPGTTTIQTRLRYMLFVPWCYQLAQAQTKTPATFAQRVDRLERDLIAPLKLGDDAEGVFGSVAGEHVKRLPSSVYWSGLHRWGIRREPWSLRQVEQSIVKLRRRTSSVQRTDEGEAYAQLGLWHADLPEIPKGFPDGMTFALRPEEAAFLKGRIVAMGTTTLLAWLVLDEHDLDVDAPWQLADLPDELRQITEMARVLSLLIHGAALLYNLLLAREPHPQPDFARKIRDDRERELEAWQQALSTDDIRRWDLAGLKRLVYLSDHGVTPETWSFVEALQTLVMSGEALLGSTSAAQLVRAREAALKRSRSRFSNHEMRAAWSGYAGAGRIIYRWPTVKRLLNDLRAGLKEER